MKTAAGCFTYQLLFFLLNNRMPSPDSQIFTATPTSEQHRACNSSHSSCCRAGLQRCLSVGQLQWLLLPFQCIDNAMQHSTMHSSSNMQLKTVSNGLLQSCSESELAFFCMQLTLNLRNSARTTSQVGLPSSPADICEWIKNHFSKGSPERERLNANTDC